MTNPPPNPYLAPVRLIINIPETGELADDVILEAIDQATVYVNDQKNPGTNASMVTLAIKNLAAFWAFQTYSDRLHHNVIGTFTAAGDADPLLQKMWERETREKLNGLESRFLQIMKVVGATPQSIPLFSSIR